ncbi:hypothetical protein NDU88_001941 [Pleurodeles waltl]|uniref:Uncharacterized protein n=1 Tax=Pleurodeles waltl TaxID=8319 RepID=A0AAV7LZ37_PLEWA|nr:hypothetical protein NDU88_001941 [Pleurodeles waltl]
MSQGYHPCIAPKPDQSTLYPPAWTRGGHSDLPVVMPRPHLGPQRFSKCRGLEVEWLTMLSAHTKTTLARTEEGIGHPEKDTVCGSRQAAPAPTNEDLLVWSAAGVS